MKETILNQRLKAFTAESLNWCALEAEQGTSRVTDAITALIADTARVSESSKDSLVALNKLQTVLKDNINVKNLQKSLETLSRENSEIDTYIQPIIESLQFQDRLRQNLENIVKMIGVWQSSASSLGESLSESELKAFGEQLMKNTVTIRERDIIRKHIADLPEEQATPNVSFF